MSKTTVLIAGFAGYVLGARAGRERYEQIRSLAVRVWGNPAVQERVSVLEDKAGDAARSAAGLAQEKAAAAASSVADRVRHRGGSADAPAAGSATTTTTTATAPTAAPQDATPVLGDQHSTRTADAR